VDFDSANTCIRRPHISAALGVMSQPPAARFGLRQSTAASRRTLNHHGRAGARHSRPWRGPAAAGRGGSMSAPRRPSVSPAGRPGPPCRAALSTPSADEMQGTLPTASTATVASSAGSPTPPRRSADQPNRSVGHK